MKSSVEEEPSGKTQILNQSQFPTQDLCKKKSIENLCRISFHSFISF